jgi:hypothetical protein
MSTDPSQIVADRLVDAVMSLTGFTESQVYVSIQAAYIEGQSPQTVQVIPGGDSPDEVDEGGWPGGTMLITRQQFDLVYWLRIKLDQFKRSEQVLENAARGTINMVAALRQGLLNTTLGGASLAPLRYERTSEVSWYDEDSGVAQVTVTFSANYAQELPSFPSIDLTGWHSTSSSSSSSSSSG